MAAIPKFRSDIQPGLSVAGLEICEVPYQTVSSGNIPLEPGYLISGIGGFRDLTRLEEVICEQLDPLRFRYSEGQRFDALGTTIGSRRLGDLASPKGFQGSLVHGHALMLPFDAARARGFPAFNASARPEGKRGIGMLLFGDLRSSARGIFASRECEVMYYEGTSLGSAVVRCLGGSAVSPLIEGTIADIRRRSRDNAHDLARTALRRIRPRDR